MIYLGCFNQAVMDATGMSTFWGIAEQPGFHANAKWADGIFSQNITDI